VVGTLTTDPRFAVCFRLYTTMYICVKFVLYVLVPIVHV